MILSGKLDGILNLFKAEPPAPPTSPSAPASPGVSAPQPTGAAGKPRGGKYIRRWWESDHWEYEYTDDQHPTAHGMEDAWQDDHTLDVTGTDGAPREGMEVPSNDSMQLAYQRSVERGPHTKEGYEGTVTHPVTGQSFQLSVGGPVIRGGVTQQTISITPVDGSGNKTELLTTPGLKRVRGVSANTQSEAWADVNNWFRAQNGPM